MQSYLTASPLAGVIATLEEQTAALRRIAGNGAGVTFPDPDEAAVIAQLKPDADPVFGGMLLRITQTRNEGVRGYFLVPHRGGCREAWWRAHHADIWRIGRLAVPEPPWAFRCLTQQDRKET